MTTSKADPQANREYVSGTNGARQDAYDARTSLIDAYDAFVAALPDGYVVSDRPDIAGSLGRSRDVDAYVGVVADRFEEAGAAGEDGVFTMDAALLASIPYESQFTDQQRRNLRARAETELARIREHLSDGTPDETTLGEMVAALGWMRFEIDKAETPEDKQAVAEDLIDTMGAGDLDEMLGLLDRQLADGADPDTIRSYTEDLAVVVSWGLEGNTGRAAGWARPPRATTGTTTALRRCWSPWAR